MNLKQKAYIIIKNLLLSVEGLAPFEYTTIKYEFDIMIFDTEYREYCDRLNVNMFFNFEYESLSQILICCFTWDRTHSKHNFWSNIHRHLQQNLLM